MSRASRPTRWTESPLPIVVRRARPGDGAAILAFSSRTWDGWDYIPEVWDAWLRATDGVLLVATPAVPREGIGHELDRFGRPLDEDRPVALVRLAMLSPTEAWLEGLRVDPGVRMRGVATTLTAACLAWSRAQGATTVRWATGEGNEGSHRLAAVHGLALLRPWRGYEAAPLAEAEEVEEAAEPVTFAGAGIGDEDGAHPGDVDRVELGEMDARAMGEIGTAQELAFVTEGQPDDQARFEETLAALGPLAETDEATRVRRALAAAGLSLPRDGGAATIDGWWARVDADPTFVLGDRLYEGRSWAFQGLDRGRFAAHVRAGEAVARERDGSWALLIVPIDAGIVKDEHPRTALVAGDGRLGLELVGEVGRLIGRSLRIRLPDPHPPFLRGQAAAMASVGLVASEHSLHLFARGLGPDDAYETPGGPATLRFGEPPRRVVVPPEPGGDPGPGGP